MGDFIQKKKQRRTEQPTEDEYDYMSRLILKTSAHQQMHFHPTRLERITAQFTHHGIQPIKTAHEARVYRCTSKH